jgi:hypothetical protein
MMRIILVAAALVAASAPPASADDLWSVLQPCRSLADGERLACFDRVLAAHDAAPAAPASVAKPAAPAPVASTADFGAERLKPAEDAPPKPEEFLVGKVTSFGLNAFKHFTVTLDNGQIWRQLDSDTPVARLRLNSTVKIVRGFLDSYTLTIEDTYGSFKVKRIK